MKMHLGSRKFNDLIVNDTNFFGAKQIKTKETITNFGNTFKLYNTELLKNSNEINSKNRQITELRKEITDLKKENVQLRGKNTALLTNADVFALEKKKYLDSVVDALEKAIHFQRFKNPLADRSDDKNLLREMNEICKEFSQKNHIPFSALEQIFTITELATGMFSLLRLGDGNEPEQEYIPVPRKKKKRRNIRY